MASTRRATRPRGSARGTTSRTSPSTETAKAVGSALTLPRSLRSRDAQQLDRGAPLVAVQQVGQLQLRHVGRLLRLGVGGHHDQADARALQARICLGQRGGHQVANGPLGALQRRSGKEHDDRGRLGHEGAQVEEVAIGGAQPDRRHLLADRDPQAGGGEGHEPIVEAAACPSRPQPEPGAAAMDQPLALQPVEHAVKLVAAGHRPRPRHGDGVAVRARQLAQQPAAHGALRAGEARLAWHGHACRRIA